MNRTDNLESLLSIMSAGLVEATLSTDDPEIRVVAQTHLTAVHRYRERAVVSGLIFSPVPVAPELAEQRLRFERHVREGAWSDVVALTVPMMAALPGEPNSQPMHKPIWSDDDLSQT